MFPGGIVPNTTGLIRLIRSKPLRPCNPFPERPPCCSPICLPCGANTPRSTPHCVSCLAQNGTHACIHCKWRVPPVHLSCHICARKLMSFVAVCGTEAEGDIGHRSELLTAAGVWQFRSYRASLGFPALALRHAPEWMWPISQLSAGACPTLAHCSGGMCSQPHTTCESP